MSDMTVVNQTVTVTAPDQTAPMDTTDMIFVFGSNEQGKHNGGAARDANQMYGAEYGVGFGFKGKSYALPTCSRSTSQPNFEITRDMFRYYVYCFILFAKMVQAGEFAELPADTKFKVTRVGTGLAAWGDAFVAPLFAAAPDNCYFDEAWKEHLGDSKKYWGRYGQMVAVGLQPNGIAVATSTTPNDGTTV
jgi:hypothetical protein